MNNLSCREKIKLPDDFYRQALPFFYWKRFDLYPQGPFKDGPKYQFSFPLDYGYAFLLSEMIFKQGADYEGKVKIEMISKVRGREYQMFPFYPRLISTPGDTGTYPPAPAPVDSGALNRVSYARRVENNLSASPSSRLPLNVFYHYRENVFINVQLSTFFWGLYGPSFADLLLIGYLIPERKLAMWK